MAIIKRILIFLGLASAPLLLGLLITYDFIKVDWVSMMEIQPSYKAQEAPLPMPERSVPVQGAYNSAVLGAPVNPYEATENSLARGKHFLRYHLPTLSWGHRRWERAFLCLYPAA